MGAIRLGLRNTVRRWRWTALTVSGVALAAATYILLVSISASFVREIQATVNMMGSEITVQQIDSGFPELSWIAEDRLGHLVGMAGIEGGFAAAIRVTRFSSGKYFIVLGVGPEIPLLQGMQLLEGRMPKAHTREIMLGFRAARSLGVSTGDDIELQGETLRVVGVYDSGRSLLDRGAVVQLETHQDLFDVGERVNLIFLKISDGADPERVGLRIDRAFPDLEANRTDNLTSHYGQVDEISTLVGRIALVALLIIVLGVSNVMLINVSRRNEEFGALRAIGWTQQSLLVVVLVEGAALATLGGLAGIPLAQAVLSILATVDTVGYTPGAVGLTASLRAVVLSGGAGVVGCLPAIHRALRMDPARALRGD